MLNVAILVVNRAGPDEVARESDCTAGVASPCIAEWGHSDRRFAGDPLQFAGAPGDPPRLVPASPCSASRGASQHYWGVRSKIHRFGEFGTRKRNKIEYVCKRIQRQFEGVFSDTY